MAVDGGDGRAEVALSADEEKAVETFAARTRSDPDSDPLTGADLGAGPGAGRTRSVPSVPPS
jgi:Mn-containing catalase